MSRPTLLLLFLGFLFVFVSTTGHSQGTGSFGGVVVTDSGQLVAGATVLYNNVGKCVRSPSGSPQCSLPTVNSSVKTDSDGRFLVTGMPADFFYIHALRAAPNLLGSCDWPSYFYGGDCNVTLSEGQSITNLRLIMGTGTLIVLDLQDPGNYIARGALFSAGVRGDSGYYVAFENGMVAVPRSFNPRLLLYTTMVVLNEAGESIPIGTPSMQILTGPDQVRLRLTATAALVNAASFWPGIAPGAITSLFGTGLTRVRGIVVANRLPLPLELEGTSVLVNGIAAPLFAVANVNGQEQINFQVPLGFIDSIATTVLVNNNGTERRYYTSMFGPPGIFVNQGQPAIQHANWSLVTQANPARRGEQIVLWATGVGPVDQRLGNGMPAPATEPLARCVYQPTVVIGGQGARVGFCGLAPGFVGLYQVNATVPENISPGLLDLRLDYRGNFGNTVKLPVQ